MTVVKDRKIRTALRTNQIAEFVNVTISYRHAAFSERRVRSDQRRTENTLSTNRQSQLESDYVIEFKDGTRVDAIDIITTRVGRSSYRGNKISSTEYLKCCRLACFIFEVMFLNVIMYQVLFYQFFILYSQLVTLPPVGILCCLCSICSVWYLFTVSSLSSTVLNTLDT